MIISTFGDLEDYSHKMVFLKYKVFVITEELIIYFWKYRTYFLKIIYLFFFFIIYLNILWVKFSIAIIFQSLSKTHTITPFWVLIYFFQSYFYYPLFSIALTSCPTFH